MNTTTPTPAELLDQIARIPLMERGKLSSYRPKGRPAHVGPYHKLQHWDHGKNRTSHVRPEQVPLLEQALAGYERFCQLTEQYAQLVIEQTRQQLAGVGEKKTPGPVPAPVGAGGGDRATDGLVCGAGAPSRRTSGTGSRTTKSSACGSPWKRMMPGHSG